MKKLLLILTLSLPALALADVWRWKDDGGRLHYSNVPARVPAGSALVAGSVGRIEAETPVVARTTTAGELAGYEQARRQREIRRRLDEIAGARARLEATRRAHYERLYGGAISPPPIPATRVDRWQALGAEEARLKQELAALR